MNMILQFLIYSLGLITGIIVCKALSYKSNKPSQEQPQEIPVQDDDKKKPIGYVSKSMLVKNDKRRISLND